MDSICIIPARGGSKRIPRKNIKDFMGKPIIAYPIELALRSGLFKEVIVSTDDEEIAEISKKYGASVPFLRSNESSSDFATTFDVLKEVLTKYKSTGIEFQYACCLYPCTPLITHDRLLQGYQKLKESDFDTVFPIIQYATPIQRAFKIKEDMVTFISEEFKNMRSQDLESAYYDSGQFYWFKPERALAEGSILTNKTGSLIISELEAQDMDNLLDWEMAILKYNILHKNENI